MPQLLVDGEAWSGLGDDDLALAQAVRADVNAMRAKLSQSFDDGTPVAELVALYTRSIDAILTGLWALKLAPFKDRCTLVAVGGYGRAELHPHSDIDLLILLGDDDDTERDRALETFLTLLWDIGLEVGHSVRSVAECVAQARDDDTVITTLVEARYLAGDSGLHEAMLEATSAEHIWDSQAFFAAKLAEQQQRRKRFGEANYNLEPNVKESPGGLRDVHILVWVLKRHFKVDNIDTIYETGFLTREECKTLLACRDFLWRIRFALHLQTDRHEDRLLFDHQRALAVQLGYTDSDERLAVEQFMMDYYKHAMELDRLNEMLLQYFQEAIVEQGAASITPINARFQVRNGYLEVVDPATFANNRFSILEAFLLMQQHRELKGIRASTVRGIRAHLSLVNDSFRQDIRARSMFLEMFKQPRGLTHELRRMNRYGVLAAFLPDFGRIVGLMQYDLYHVYTVDEHTLTVVRNLRRLAVPEFADEFPLASRIINELPKPHLLYLGGLFHDIAKGRGGDHSSKGEVIALAFCGEIGLPPFDSRLVAWLVSHHLDMSRTAQREDISDPEVVTRFAELVGDQLHLDYLYLLTLADIRGTNPRLWNSWKDSLLQDLYHSTRRALRRGLENPIDVPQRVTELQNSVAAALTDKGYGPMQVHNLWQYLDDGYFLRHSEDEILRHSMAILNRFESGKPLVEVTPETHRGGTEVFIYTAADAPVFRLVTRAFERLRLNIQDARIITTRHDLAMNTFIVLDENNDTITDSARLQDIQQRLEAALAEPATLPAHSSLSDGRRQKQFRNATQLRVLDADQNGFTVLEISAADRIGLLSRIADALAEEGVDLNCARIATYGERAEDVLYLCEQDHHPLAAQRQQHLMESIAQAIDS